MLVMVNGPLAVLWMFVGLFTIIAAGMSVTRLLPPRQINNSKEADRSV
jgi:NADH:ubiquinone oxidoreductase subunit 3 (subunit A)